MIIFDYICKANKKLNYLIQAYGKKTFERVF